MKPNRVDFAVMDDDERWADPYECFEPLVAGIWYLYERLESRDVQCPLARRIRELGNRFEELNKVVQSSSKMPSAPDLARVFEEMNTLGTLGYALWHLRQSKGASALQYELRELAKVGCGENENADTLRLRGQGFLLLAAATLAKQGFDVEFIDRRDGQKTPDFFAYRDGNRFSCEATTRSPKTGDFMSEQFFWSTINEIIRKKSAQLTTPEFGNGVLLIDCTPIWDALHFVDIPTGGVLVYEIPENVGGPRSGSVPLVRYDQSHCAQRLRNLEEIIRGTGIHTVIFWKWKLEVSGDTYRRHMAYRVLGTIDGAVFWSYFDKALAFPGPNVNVVWS